MFSWQDNWVRDCRKLGEAVDKYTKTKTSYAKAANEWEKSLTQRQAAEESKYKLKLDKVRGQKQGSRSCCRTLFNSVCAASFPLPFSLQRNKEESDLRQKVADLRSAHVASLGTGNAARADLLRTREEVIELMTVRGLLAWRGRLSSHLLD
jgi:hypothetical protein